MKRRLATSLAALAVATLVLAPAIAEARRGASGFGGSRGAQTFQAPPSTRTAPQVAPLQRTQQTPQTGPTAAAPGTRAAAPAAGAARGGFMQRNPFLGGMMMGLFGAGLFGLLAGSGFFSGLGSLAGILGFLLQILLIAGIVMLVMTMLRRRAQPQPAGMAPRTAGGPGAVPGMARDAGGPLPMGGAAPRPAVALTEQDFNSFEQLLKTVTLASARGDFATIARHATPEVLRNFEADHATLGERGPQDAHMEVVLDQGDLSEAWAEGARDYATVAMRFTMTWPVQDLPPGKSIRDVPHESETTTELWTFLRVQGGPWMLSAIQQGG